MKTLKHVLFIVAICSFSFLSCKKPCKDDRHCIKERKGLPMNGSQEVPAKETNAYGTIDVSYNKCKQVLTYTLKWADLSGGIVGSHIHGTAAKGENAGVKHDFTELIPKTMSGKFTNSVKIDGIAIKQDSLLAGYYYFNLHTPKNPGGEIRGQIVF